jgi:hypothetical protein
MSNSNEQPVRSRTGPEVVAPTSRINVALPFSKILTVEPSQELRDLATVVAELAAVIERLAPDADAQGIRARARALAARLN